VRTSNDLSPRSNNAEERDAAAAVPDDDDDDNAAPPGIVLRTDYTAGSDDAWAAFCSALRDAEREFLSDQDQDQDQDQGSSTSISMSAPDDDGDVEMAPAPHSPVVVPAAALDAAASGDDDDEDEEEEEELALFSLVADSTRFDGISNLRALRLLFDISVRAAPAQPSSSSLSSGSAHHHQKQKQHQHEHEHRLTRQRGLQETYDTRGRTLWIFDARSRIDGCARLVSEAGDIATSVVDSSLSCPPGLSDA